MVAAQFPDAGGEFPLLCLGEVTSVLDSALDLAKGGKLPLFGAVLADSQTMGRGQMRRRWHSPPGNLHLGVRLPADGIFAGTAASVRIGIVLAEVLGEFGFDVRVKWPNDLVVPSADGPGIPGKVGGVLLEDRGGALLAGIGINLLHAALPDPAPDGTSPDASIPPGGSPFPPPLLPDAPPDPLPAAPTADDHPALPPASLASLGPEVPERIILCGSIVKALNSAYSLETALPDQWLLRARRLLLWLGETVVLADGPERVRGRLSGVTREGALLIDAGGTPREFTGGTLRKE
ncbi:MAG: biotin--acetyl-CoA-carboxylase ligase [Desulfovibrio sp.]|jgi:BirA family biotin operon repressor/biotin-[acetyl-CoA-carboxylase] ligase|nr:biotin--acetyl-CoA-carboxylase ligase [Desulfovibrio sp.]